MCVWSPLVYSTCSPRTGGANIVNYKIAGGVLYAILVVTFVHLRYNVTAIDFAQLIVS